MSFSLDGRTVLSADELGTFVLWDVASGQEIHRYTGHGYPVSNLILSPDGSTVFSNEVGTSVVQWDLATGQEIRRFAKTGSEYGSYVMALSPDGLTFLTIGERGIINVWDVGTGALQKTLGGFGSSAFEMYFSPDGRYVFSILEQEIIQWDLTSGEAIHRYPTAWTWSVMVHPDGHSVFSTDGDGWAYQWRVDSFDELMAWISTNRYVRELTCSERASYNLEPGCDNQGTFPTRTPYPTLQPSAMPTPTSPVAVALITSTPAATVTPTVTPRPVLTAQRGIQRGEVAIGDDQTWEYTGRDGETLTIQVAADQPCNWEMRPTKPASCLDTQVFIRAPDGTPLNLYAALDFTVIQPPESDDITPGTNTDSRIDDLALPEDGIYRIIVSGAGYQTGGAYTLTIESTPPEADTPTPGP